MGLGRRASRDEGKLYAYIALMNTNGKVALTLLSTLILPLSCAFAQQYAVPWFKVAGGGGASINGQYSLSGTCGQPDASKAMTSGQYSITGGFWVLPQPVQVIGAPALNIAPAGAGQATISWTPNTPGFVLLESLGLSPTNWINSASGATNPISVPATSAAKFYRLNRP